MGTNSAFFRCLRRCPSCRRELFTNGKGNYYCQHCDFRQGVEERSIERYQRPEFVGYAEAGWYV
jgi:tRNA(Ile2) C34 agmatinyltransferase TiaS